MLRLTESCDFGLDRWLVNGEVNYLSGAGLRQGKGFTISSNNERMVNRISRQFRPIDSMDEQRAFRLSFWIKVEGKPYKNSEFISITSTKEECGAMIGLTKNGQLYATRLSAPDMPGFAFTDESPALPNIADSKYHYVEIDAKYDADWTGRVSIYIDNVLCAKKNGMNLDGTYCWSRPDRISFGNLIGANVSLDDIIVWDDSGDHVGYRGSTIVNSTALHLQENVLRGVGDYSFGIDTKNSIAAMVTMTVAGEEATEADIRPVTTYDKQVVYGPEKRLITNADTRIEVSVKGGVINTSVGIERIR